jgi:glycosyltransferase 2 family protein
MLETGNPDEAAPMTAGPDAAGRPASYRRAWRLGLIAGKVAITLAILYVVLNTVDLASLAQRIARIDRALFAVAIAVVLMQVGLVSLRWYLVMRRLQAGGQVALGDAAAITMTGLFVNQFMPFAAGDALRAALAAGAGATARIAVTSVLIDRGLGVLFLLLIAAPPLFLSGFMEQAPAASRILLAIIVVPLLALLVVLLWREKLLGLLAAYRLTRPAAAALADTLTILLNRPALAATASLSLLIHASTVGLVTILSHAVGVPMPAITVWAVVPPMLLVTMLPFTISGWGAREGVVVAFLLGAGIPADGAFLLSVSFGAAMLVAALPGALTWFRVVRWKS